MSEVSHVESPISIWGKLGEGAQTLACALASGGGVSLSEEEALFLIPDSHDLSIKAAKEELVAAGVLEEVTLLQEETERLGEIAPDNFYLSDPPETLPPSRVDALFSNGGNVPDYQRLVGAIKEAERAPGSFPQWYSPRYRLQEGFQNFVAKNII